MRIIEGVSEALAWCEERLVAPLFDAGVEARVAAIIEQVRAGGDAALLELTESLDGVRLAAPIVTDREVQAAAARVDPGLAAAIDLAIARVTAYYEAQRAPGFEFSSDGARLGLLVKPLASVGCYVPGGTAPLFSSLIMTAVPARVAGVARLVVATPPDKTGSLPAEIAYVAVALGVQTVVLVGGAQAIAALAFGTESLRRVDKVVGPGNRYVVAAKRQLFGAVGIESLPGPTETLVLADDTASVIHVVSDLLAQAEHVGAQPVLVTTNRELAGAVSAEIDLAAGDLPTATDALASLAHRGVVVLVDDVEQGLAVLNAYAPEHACLLVEDAVSVATQVDNAGGIFIGHYSLEALGDYIAGPSHVMPTGGTARFASFVNLRDFQKVIPFLEASAGFVAAVGPSAALMARAEGLEAHARAIEARLTPRP
jgi:histidinol dehydrogenase